ncbi:hypothetical protein LOK49_LG06G01706 [Camellia lanceoleosa]|uniref:Uncharacterized protein n=1 Tax=Camellia lanceoleosa TaxID=1840588 RepID=A0ACC0HH53_9ERIC|nr:hypothetical protein LOK49_LG06G01706 [Camellia lanceoleosa]
MEEGTANITIDRYAKLVKGSWFSQFHNGSNPWMARYVYGLISNGLHDDAPKTSIRNGSPLLPNKIFIFNLLKSGICNH